jgi:glycosyltransferase involved in cell wall biosynthesis
MMASSIAFVIPGDINTRSGGYGYDRKIITELQSQGRAVSHIALGSSFPNPTDGDQIEAAKILGELSGDSPVVIDGLALGALKPAVVASISAPIVALIHHPLAFEGTLSAKRREFLFETEYANLQEVDRVVVTSEFTAQLLIEEYGVKPNLMTVATPGVDRVDCQQGRSIPPLILSVGTQIPRKGHDVLLEALAKIEGLPWRAIIVGAPLDRAYSDSLTRMIRELGLVSRVEILENVSDEHLSALYCQASLFALATRFEGYGMVFGEAMVHGLPIVSSLAGAVPDTVKQGGILLKPDEPELFADALESILVDAKFRELLAKSSASSGAKLGTWGETAAILASVIDGL